MPAKDWKTAPAKDRAKKVIPILADHYEAKCALDYDTPFQLLVATILSAQCTDVRVNMVTPLLFEQYPDPAEFVEANPDDIEELIRSTGFFRQKTKSILAVSEAIVTQYDGKVPDDMEALTSLPGVGRKTANVVLGTAYGHPAITVDTHVKRLSNRLKFTQNSNPDKIEQDLIEIIPAKERTDFSHRLIWHGRKICTAKKPDCPSCMIAKFCPAEDVG